MLFSNNQPVLGKLYQDGDIIIKQGDTAECMFLIQSGRVEVILENENGVTTLSEMGKSDIFGEMALFDKSPRSATVRAKGETRVLTIDKRSLMRRIHEDPLLVLRILEHMSKRIRYLSTELSKATATSPSEV